MKTGKTLIASLVLLVCYAESGSLNAFSANEPKQAAVRVSKSWNEANLQKLGRNGTVLNAEFPDKAWWEKFNDANLNTYIRAALQNNPTVNGGLQKIIEARAVVRQNIATELPSINLNPNAYRIALPSNVKGVLPVKSPLHLYTLPLQATYELDLWGKNLDTVKASRKQADATELQAHAVLNGIIGEVAGAYVNLMRMDALVDIQQQNLTLLNRVAHLKESRNKVGLVSYDEVVRARRDAAEAETSLSVYKQQQAVFAHQLSILTGTPPANQSQLTRSKLADMSLPLQTESGSPEELLTRRPDVLAQERVLESARINVRVARKAFLPTINLGALVGTGALGFKNLWDWGNVFNLQSLAINQPVFRGGQLMADLKYRKAKQQEELENYRQVILTAMKEVEDSLSNLRASYEVLDSSTERLNLTNRTLQLTENLYQQGLAPRLDVFQTQSELLRYQQTAIQSKADTAISTVSLYKALGGGF